MKTVKVLLCSLLLVGTAVLSHGQDAFNSCSAAFLDKVLIVNEYSPEGTCVLPHDAKGTLTAGEAELLGGRKANITNYIEFMVAIRDKKTKTLMMFSSEVYKKLDIQKVMEKCKKGDSIVILTLNNAYALPHNEILVQ